MKSILLIFSIFIIVPVVIIDIAALRIAGKADKSMEKGI